MMAEMKRLWSSPLKWLILVAPFVLDDKPAKQLSARGRYWASRTLLAVAESFEAQSRSDQAREAYILLINRGLPGQAIARASLARLGALK